jgi:prolyl-tRNA synthetase
MNAMYLDSEGRLKPVIMGCYGIGVSRILAATIEQSHDEKGIIWPISIAPFKVSLIAINVDDTSILKSAEDIYKALLDEGIDVLFDDRNCRAGVKFKDSDLIGIPVKMIIGRNYIENKKLEIELRKEGTKFTFDLKDSIDFIRKYTQNH